MKRAKTKLMLCGLNLKLALDALIFAGFEVFDVEFSDKKTMTFCVNCKDCKKVVAYLEKKCYNVKIIGKVGIAGFFAATKKHCIALSMIFLCLCFCGILGNTCLDIVVSADETVYQDVNNAIKNHGIKRGMWLSDISLDMLENHICVEVPEIKYAFVQINGCKVEISVILRDIADLPIDMTQSVDIVASCDGVVTNILVLNGTALVAVGDNVVEGQVLIQGQTTFLDGTQEPTRAMGEVYAVASSRAEMLFCPTTTYFSPTGNVVKRHCIKVGKYKSPFFKQIDFAFFVVETTVKRLFPIGIEIIFETVYETKQTTREISIEEATLDLQTKAYQKALEKAVFDYPQKTEYGRTTHGDKTYITATLYAETKISTIGGKN